jgi:hypothetical protein
MESEEPGLPAAGLPRAGGRRHHGAGAGIGRGSTNPRKRVTRGGTRSCGRRSGSSGRAVNRRLPVERLGVAPGEVGGVLGRIGRHVDAERDADGPAEVIADASKRVHPGTIPQIVDLGKRRRTSGFLRWTACRQRCHGPARTSSLASAVLCARSCRNARRPMPDRNRRPGRMAFARCHRDRIARLVGS